MDNTETRIRDLCDRVLELETRLEEAEYQAAAYSDAHSRETAQVAMLLLEVTRALAEQSGLNFVAACKVGLNRVHKRPDGACVFCESATCSGEIHDFSTTLFDELRRQAV